MAAAAPDRLLLVAPHGSYRTADYLTAGARLGVAVEVASEGRHSLASAYAQGLHIELSDFDAALARVLEAHASTPFTGVLGTDDGVTELAAHACRALGLSHNDPAAARLTARKDLARARLAEAGLPVPPHRVLHLDRPLAPQCDGLAYPVVVKPVGLSGSRGVIRADNEAGLLAACARAQTILARSGACGEAGGRLLVEGFIPGFEIAVEGLLRRGVLTLLAVFDKPEPLDGPFFEESYYVTPTRLDPDTVASVRGVLEQACAAYGLREGPIHAECRLNRAGVFILEIAARTIGGLCSRLFTIGAGVALEDLVIAHALGRAVEPRPMEGGVGVLMIPIPAAGVLRRVEGIGAAKRVPFIEELIIDVREGYELVPLPEGESYLGFIFARGPDAAAVEEALRAAHACLRIVIAPIWGRPAFQE